MISLLLSFLSYGITFPLLFVFSHYCLLFRPQFKLFPIPLLPYAFAKSGSPCPLLISPIPHLRPDSMPRSPSTSPSLSSLSPFLLPLSFSYTLNISSSLFSPLSLPSPLLPSFLTISLLLSPLLTPALLFSLSLSSSPLPSPLSKRERGRGLTGRSAEGVSHLLAYPWA